MQFELGWLGNMTEQPLLLQSGCCHTAKKDTRMAAGLT